MLGIFATMSKLQIVKDKLLNLQQVFTFYELEYLFGKFGYVEKKKGKTSGSRKAYFNKATLHIIRLHKPHPGNEIKRYLRVYIISELKKQGLL